MLGMDIQYACPKGYDPAPEIVERAKALAEKYGTKIRASREPAAAIKGAHAVATDTWVSMGDEAETLQREKAFKGYTLTDAMLEEHAAPGAIFLHCLPGHWGQEATYELAHGPKSVIFDEAENRMWAQMALLLKILKIELVDNPKNTW